jgi:hypothetical protein
VPPGGPLRDRAAHPRGRRSAGVARRSRLRARRCAAPTDREASRRCDRAPDQPGSKVACQAPAEHLDLLSQRADLIAGVGQVGARARFGDEGTREEPPGPFPADLALAVPRRDDGAWERLVGAEQRDRDTGVARHCWEVIASPPRVMSARASAARRRLVSPSRRRAARIAAELSATIALPTLLRITYVGLPTLDHRNSPPSGAGWASMVHQSGGPPPETGGSDTDQWREPPPMISTGDDVEAHALRKRGWTISAIARHLDHDSKTVRDHLSGKRELGVRRRPLAGVARRRCSLPR